jgi:hypothetical protein
MCMRGGVCRIRVIWFLITPLVHDIGETDPRSGGLLGPRQYLPIQPIPDLILHRGNQSLIVASAAAKASSIVDE